MLSQIKRICGYVCTLRKKPKQTCNLILKGVPDQLSLLKLVMSCIDKGCYFYKTYHSVKKVFLLLFLYLVVCFFVVGFFFFTFQSETKQKKKTKINNRSVTLLFWHRDATTQHLSNLSMQL